MPIAMLLAQAAEMTSASIRFAEGIDYATSGERLGRVMKAAMNENPGAYGAVRAAVGRRVDELGGAGQAMGLFMLAADMATTATVGADQLKDGEQQELRRLWHDLLHAEADPVTAALEQDISLSIG